MYVSFCLFRILDTVDLHYNLPDDCMTGRFLHSHSYLSLSQPVTSHNKPAYNMHTWYQYYCSVLSAIILFFYLISLTHVHCEFQKSRAEIYGINVHITYDSNNAATM